MNESLYHYGSFRDPSGFVFSKGGQIFRKINPSFLSTYKLLKEKLFNKLIESQWLIPYIEVSNNPENFIIKPEIVPFVSYPYEWCFNQLKDAALLTLKIQYEALKNDFILKDASAFNVQFIGKKPIFIDITSFQKYKENIPWHAYKQFCEHFIAPLLLMKYSNIKPATIWLSNIDGFPLQQASKILPLKTYFKNLSSIHIHGHAKVLKIYEKKDINPTRTKIMPKNKLFKLIEHLYDNISNLNYTTSSYWNMYYKLDHVEQLLSEKLNFIENNLITSDYKFLIDIGCNEGYFSKKNSKKISYIISLDGDERVIDNLYTNLKTDEKILPLVIDITNPSPSRGWKDEERDSFLTRIGSNNIVLALAIVHHLRIFYNIPLIEIAHFFSTICKQLIVEFVPKEDSQTQKLLQNKEDVYCDYTQQNFESVFEKYFLIQNKKNLNNSNRTIYNMIKK